MHKELKKVIINWLLENENQWQRTNACREQFRNYIYDSNGNHIIGGEVVSNFISEADKLLYSQKHLVQTVETKKLSVNQGILNFLNRIRNDKTKKSKCTDLKLLFHELFNKDIYNVTKQEIESLTPDKIDDYLFSKENYSKATLNRKITTIKQLINFLVRSGLINYELNNLYFLQHSR